MNMRWTIAVALLAALLTTDLAAAQPPTFTQAFQVRIGVGDIATTAAHETADGWSYEARYTVQHPASDERVDIQVLPGSQIVAKTCSCGNFTTTESATSVAFHIPASVPTGPVTVTVTTTSPPSAVFAVDLTIKGNDGLVVLYLPNGFAAQASAPSTSPGTSTDGGSIILAYADLQGSFWLTVNPVATAIQPTSESSSMVWFYAAAGVVVGCILWAILVSRGMVQRKTRKQVATTAAHVEAAKMDSPAILEGRKRALMAALKEIELGRQADEIDVATYDTLKAELKKEAVTVMRAIDESGAKKT